MVRRRINTRRYGSRIGVYVVFVSIESQIAAECMKYARYTSDEYALKCNPNIYMKIIRINMQILNKNMQNIET